MVVGMWHCRLVSPPSAARLCPRAQEEPAMIHALLTMPLAMPLEKMAKGDEGAKAQALEYFTSRGCVLGGYFAVNPSKSEAFGSQTYSACSREAVCQPS